MHLDLNRNNYFIITILVRLFFLDQPNYSIAKNWSILHASCIFFIKKLLKLTAMFISLNPPVILEWGILFDFALMEKEETNKYSVHSMIHEKYYDLISIYRPHIVYHNRANEWKKAPGSL